MPRAQLFPTGPVSADAVLLTSLGVERAVGADGLPRGLIVAVVADLVRRGVRALEAFGRTEAAAELVDPGWCRRNWRPVMEVLGDCSVDQCILDADFLKQVGFVEVVASTATSLGFAWSWRGVWAGRPASRPRWSGCWRARRAEATGGRRRGRAVSADRLAAAGLFDRQLVCEQFGERERAGGAVVLAQQVEPLDRREDALGDRSRGSGRRPACRDRADW